MFKDIGEDIYERKLEYTFLSLISDKVRVGIIGGGEAGYIKAKALVNRGCNVSIISPNYCGKFNEFENTNLKIIKDRYSTEYIKDKHLVVIAVKDKELIDEITKDCEELNKLYLNCSDFKKGNFVVPVQKNSKELNFAMNTKGGSPRTTLFMAENFKALAEDYDDFINYACNLRKHVKEYTYKDEIMRFINSSDFKLFYDKGYGNSILKMFYDDI